MAGHRRPTPRQPLRQASRQAPRASARASVLTALALTLAVVAAGCSWSRLDDASTGDSSGGEMRSVPTVTVPPTDMPDENAVVPPTQPDTTQPDTTEPVTTPPVPTEPVTNEPVTTDLIGDPRPDPDSDLTLPPLPDGPVVDACVRLADAAVVEQLGTALGGGVATAESLDVDACRLASRSGWAEVHYLSEGTVESDWFRRAAIEPVGDVTADAVGLAMFVVPGSESGAGYTIALVSRRQGAVIAVRGTPDDRAVAVQLAGLVVGTT